MNQLEEPLHFAGSCRASYLVRVLGNVSARWLDYYTEMSIIVSIAPGLPPVTTIGLHRADQAALLGLLNHLYDFGYPLMYVEQLVNKESADEKEEEPKCFYADE